jgi:hypothetical protein
VLQNRGAGLECDAQSGDNQERPCKSVAATNVEIEAIKEPIGRQMPDVRDCEQLHWGRRARCSVRTQVTHLRAGQEPGKGQGGGMRQVSSAGIEAAISLTLTLMTSTREYRQNVRANRATKSVCPGGKSAKTRLCIG